MLLPSWLLESRLSLRMLCSELLKGEYITFIHYFAHIKMDICSATFTLNISWTCDVIHGFKEKDSPPSLVFTAQAVLMSFPATAGVGATAPLETAAGFLFAFIVASSELSASSGNGARRLAERPCLRVWVNLSRRKRFDILLHQDWKRVDTKERYNQNYYDILDRKQLCKLHFYLKASFVIGRHGDIVEGLSTLGARH